MLRNKCLHNKKIDLHKNKSHNNMYTITPEPYIADNNFWNHYAEWKYLLRNFIKYNFNQYQRREDFI